MAKDPSKTDLAQSRTEWAESRTDWAEDRTIMANERTYAAWMRTGLACIVIALALQAVFGAVQPPGLAKSVASLFLTAAIIIFWMARRNAAKSLDALHARNCAPQSTRQFTAMATLLTIATLATGVVLWLL